MDPIAAARSAVLATVGLSLAAAALLWARTTVATVRRWRCERPRALRLLLAAVTTAIALGTVEALLRTPVLAAPLPDVMLRAPGFVVADPALGYRLDRDRVVEVELVRTRDEQVVRRVQYGLDAEGHRRTVLPQAAGHDRAVLFFGCSQTFGHGLADGETVPSRYAAAMPRDAVQNLAVPGYGPHHALQLASTEGGVRVPPFARRPVAVFLWIDHHLQRLCGALRVRNGYGLGAPCWALCADGGVDLLGPFQTAERLRTACYWALGKSELLRRAGFDWPPAPGDAERALATAVVRELGRRLDARGIRLLFAVHPDAEIGRRIAGDLGPGVVTLDLGGTLEPYGEGMALDQDGHPTPSAADRLGLRIAQAVRIAFP